MFCEKCGTQLPDTAKYCTNCGINLAKGQKETNEIQDNVIQLEIKPTYSFICKSIPLFIMSIILVLISSSVFFIIDFKSGVIAALVGLFAFTIYICIISEIKKGQYESLSYEFYKTKIVYKDDFLTKSEKEVKYKNIREVNMTQSFLQGYFNLGNIIVYTSAESGLGNGICITDVKNVEEVYKTVKSLIYT